jgi:hypothetical protein
MNLKKLTILLFLSFGYFSSHGQTLVIDLGTSYSRLDWKYKDAGWSEKQYNDPILSYSFSAGCEYLEHKLWSLKSDLSYYKSGGQYSSEELDADYIFISAHKISVNYLSLGSYINFFPVNNKFRLQLSVGPRVDFLISGSAKDPYKWIDKYGGLNKLNWGISTGLGLYYKLEKTTVGLNARVLTRMKKLADLEPTYTNPGNPGAEAKEQVILLGISLGYKLF